MLAPADAAVAARDPSVPGIATVLDPSRLEGVLAGALRRSGLTLRSAHLGYLRYRPGRALLGSVRIVTDAGEGLAYVEARDRGRPPVALAAVRVRRRGPVPPVLTWVPWADPLTGVAIGPSVVDPVLPGARELTVHDRRFLHRVDPGDREHRPEHQVREVRHKPARRWVGRVDRDGAPWALAKAVPRHDVGRLTEALAHLGRDVPVAPLVHVDARRGLYLVRWVPGRAVPAEPGPEVLQEVGAALARLHAHAAPSGWTVPDLVSTLEVAVRAVDEVMPSAGRDARRVAARVQDVLSGSRARCLVHGDLSPDQVVLTPGGPVLVDLDRCRVDHPLADVASWLAARVADGRSADVACAEADALLSGDRDARAAGADVRELGALTSLALLRRATEPFRYRRDHGLHGLAGRLGRTGDAPADGVAHPDWQAGLTALLRHALDLASGARPCV